MKKVISYSCLLIVLLFVFSFIYGCKKKNNDTTQTSMNNGIIFNPNLIYGTVSDIDGNVYKTITIGSKDGKITQTWMAENFKVTHYCNGDAIPNVTDNAQWSGLTSGAYCNYLNDNSYVNTYGRIYNWYTTNDSRGLAPIGWHVPSDAEFKTLEMTLGMSQAAADSMCFRGTDQGDKLKETGISHWGTNYGTNSSGFTAIPAGARCCGDGAFDINGFHSCGSWWTNTQSNPTTSAWSRSLLYDERRIERIDAPKVVGYSVRCVKN